jgi:hypothetical protein
MNDEKIESFLEALANIDRSGESLLVKFKAKEILIRLFFQSDQRKR